MVDKKILSRVEKNWFLSLECQFSFLLLSESDRLIFFDVPAQTQVDSLLMGLGHDQQQYPAVHTGGVLVCRISGLLKLFNILKEHFHYYKVPHHYIHI